MTDVFAEAAGLCSEEWDLDIGGSPYKIWQLLTTRAHAYAMCGGGHLHGWMQYVNRFLLHYGRKAQPGCRHFLPTEAEEADRPGSVE